MDAIVPKDLPLALPAPFWLLEFLLLLSFALHILFVNLMVGGSVMVLFTEILGFRSRDWDRISAAIAKTITVNKSLAVVIGVAPLLCINVLYTVQFYTANALTGHVWILIVPLVIAAFLLSYAHEYSWHTLAQNRGLHLSFAAGSAGLFLFVPLIFLSNINLMLYPEHWRGIGSFWDALTLPNVLPRYFHFLSASMALVGLFLARYFGRETYFATLGLETMTREQVLRAFYGVAFVATGAQLILGPVLFFTLPAHTISMHLVAMLSVIVLPLAGVVLWWLWQEARSAAPGRRFGPIVLVLSLLVATMVYARHDVRETALRPHRELVSAKTAAYMAEVEAAQDYIVMPGGLGGRPVSPGELLYQRKCTSCHAMDRRLVGPPLTEAVLPYVGNPEGIVAWTLKPGRRRMDYPVMPAQEMPEADLMLVANYILEVTGNQ